MRRLVEAVLKRIERDSGRLGAGRLVEIGRIAAGELRDIGGPRELENLSAGRSDGAMASPTSR